MRQRFQPAERKQQILEAAVFLAEVKGLTQYTRADVAAAVGCAEGLVSSYFGTIPNLRRAVMGAAISGKNLNIIAQGLALGDTRAKKAPEELRRAAVESLMGV